MRTEDPKPPRGLSREALSWRQRIIAGWVLDDAAVLILDTGLEAFDRMREAQRVIRRHGVILKGRVHPAVLVERDARLAMLRAIKQLGLDLEPLHERAGRPSLGGPRIGRPGI